MCATYVPFQQLPSGRLSDSFRKFLCAQPEYHFTSYQVGDFLICSVNSCARDVHTYHALPTILGLTQARPNNSLIIHIRPASSWPRDSLL